VLDPATLASILQQLAAAESRMATLIQLGSALPAVLSDARPGCNKPSATGAGAAAAAATAQPARAVATAETGAPAVEAAAPAPGATSGGGGSRKPPSGAAAGAPAPRGVALNSSGGGAPPPAAKAVSISAAKRLLEQYKVRLQEKQAGDADTRRPPRMQQLLTEVQLQQSQSHSDPGTAVPPPLPPAAAAAGQAVLPRAGVREASTAGKRSSAPGNIHEGQTCGLATNPIFESGLLMLNPAYSASGGGAAPSTTAAAAAGGSDVRGARCTNKIQQAGASAAAAYLRQQLHRSSGGLSRGSTDATPAAAGCDDSGSTPAVDASDCSCLLSPESSLQDASEGRSFTSSSSSGGSSMAAGSDGSQPAAGPPPQPTAGASGGSATPRTQSLVTRAGPSALRKRGGMQSHSPDSTPATLAAAGSGVPASVVPALDLELPGERCSEDSAAASASGGGAAPWLDLMLARLSKLPEHALLEVIQKLVEVSVWQAGLCAVAGWSGACGGLCWPERLTHNIFAAPAAEAGGLH
jgi:hypothetical protein